MFVHVQYHYVKGKDGKVYFIHQSQYYVSDYYDRFTNGESVNVTQVSIDEVENYEPQKYMGQGSTGDKTDIGTAMVPTDKLLAGLRKLEIIETSY